MKKYLLLILLLSIEIAPGLAQSNSTISGTIRNGITGESLIGAAVSIKEHTAIGTVTNEFGFYSITVPDSSATLLVNYTGFKTFELPIGRTTNQRQDISLNPGESLQEVVVNGKRRNDNITNAQSGMETISISDIKAIPVLFGEKDVMKVMQLLLGVKSAGEGNSGFYVRGGGADQNLVLLDGAPVYNPSHLLGFFSTFNSDAIKDATLYKGGMPAQYGGRLSSVEDIRMNDGNSKRYSVSGGLGLISSRLNVEGPLGSDKGSFIVSGRRTYADAFLQLSTDNSIKNNRLYFYDLNLKANYKLGDKDRVHISGYTGKDKLGFKDEFGLDWANTTATIRWNHLFSPKLFSNTSLIYSDYNYNISILNAEADYAIHSEIRDWNLKQEFSLFPATGTSYRFGLNLINHDITPGKLSNLTTGYEFALQNRRSLAGAAYFSGTHKLGNRLNAIYGIRVSGFAAMGAGNYYALNDAHQISDTLHYEPGKIASSYMSPNHAFLSAM